MPIRYYQGDYIPPGGRRRPRCLHFECTAFLPETFVDPARVPCPSCGRVYDLRPVVPPPPRVSTRLLPNGRVSRRRVPAAELLQIDLFQPLVRLDASGWVQPVFGGLE